METIRVDSYREAAPIAKKHPQTHHIPAESAIPYGVLETMVPTLNAVLRVRSLIAYFVVPLAAHMHAVSQLLINAVVPAAAVLLSVAYQSLLASVIAIRVVLWLSRSLAGYLSSVAATSNIQRNIERDIYSFLLGPGNALLKVFFWVGWWSLVGAFIISAPW